MSTKLINSKLWTFCIVLLLLTLGLGISTFAYRSTTQIKEALAAEVLEQQHDVATLIHEYSNVMVSLERNRIDASPENLQQLEKALMVAQAQLEVMRSNYSFARLDGAAEAHAYVKPILEDISEWTTNGIAGQPHNSAFVLNTASNRVTERYDAIRDIAVETDSVATELISQQSNFLVKFRDWLVVLLAGFGLLSLAIASLLIRQRNLQAQLAIDQDRTATKHINKETRGRHLAEHALRDSEKFLRATLNSLPSDIAILDNNGIITEVNRPWKEFSDASENPFADGGIGYHYENVFRSIASSKVDEKSVDTAIKKVSDVLSGAKDSMFFEYPRAKASDREWSLLSMTTFNTDDNRHAILAHDDVTDRKLLEERDRRLRSELAHVTRLTTAGELASGLAHELNQPLTAITHNCDAIMSSVKTTLDIDKETLDTLNDISGQAHRAGGIIRSMRQLVGKNSTDMVPTDLNELVEETVRLTGPEAREKGVKVVLDLEKNLPYPVLDPVQIQQVLVNLERNGVEAMWQANSPEKELTIKTSLAAADHVQVSVSDTGPGVDASFEQQLFTAFQTTKDDGMGLGLSISRTIVNEHGGRLWIEPNEDSLTIFKFTIPFTQE